MLKTPRSLVKTELKQLLSVCEDKQFKRESCCTQDVSNDSLLLDRTLLSLAGNLFYLLFGFILLDISLFYTKQIKQKTKKKQSCHYLGCVSLNHLCLKRGKRQQIKKRNSVTIKQPKQVKTPHHPHRFQDLISS